MSTQFKSSTSESTLSRKASPALARKAAAVQSHQKKAEIVKVIKTSQRNTNVENDQLTDPADGTDPNFQYFEDLGTRIAKRAYELYEKRGRTHGKDFEDWLEAERQVLMEHASEDSQ